MKENRIIMRKKIIISAAAIGLALFFGAFLTHNLYAEDACSINKVNDPLLCGTPRSDEEVAIMQSVESTLNVIYLWIGIISVIVIIIGGINYMTSVGDTNKIRLSKNIIFYTICGLIVTLAAFAITNLVLDAIEGATSVQDRSDGSGSNIPLGEERYKVRAIDAISRTSLIVGQTITIKARVIPDYAKDHNLTYKSSDNSIAVVDQSGLVKAKKEGKATITISSNDGPSKEVAVTVLKPIPVTSIKIDKSSVTLKKNKVVTVQATPYPTNATDKTLIWASENTKVAMVDQTGKIKGISYGDTIVTITARNKTEVAVHDNGITLSAATLAANENTVVAKVKVTVESEYYACQPATSTKKFSGNLNIRSITMKYLEPRAKDFYYSNFSGKINEFGGYTSYVKKLGGIHTMYAGKNKKIKTKSACDFQAAAEYAYGLWMVYGVDYDNGSTYHRWGDETADQSDAYWKGSGSRYAGAGYGYKDIDTNLSEDPDKFRTNCNYSCDAMTQKTDLYFVTNLCTSWRSGPSKSPVGKITNTAQLQVGDMLHYFRDGDWKHVAVVGEVYSDYIITYDGGGRFISSKQYKKKIKRGGSMLNGTTYSSYDYWFGVRLWKIDQSRTLEGLR